MNAHSALRRLSTCVRNCHHVHRTGQRMFSSSVTGIFLFISAISMFFPTNKKKLLNRRLIRGAIQLKIHSTTLLFMKLCRLGLLFRMPLKRIKRPKNDIHSKENQHKKLRLTTSKTFLTCFCSLLFFVDIHQVGSETKNAKNASLSWLR